MDKEVIFPTAEELQYLANQKISHNPKLSQKEAQDLVHKELCKIITK